MDLTSPVLTHARTTSAVVGHAALDAPEKLSPRVDACRLSSRQRTRELAFRICAGQVTEETLVLLVQSPREWQSLLVWLDASGLALYFADALLGSDNFDRLPRGICDSLRRRLCENEERTHGMIRESTCIQRAFDASHLNYALMKGESLAPFSVPRLELRHQFDLDYLIAEKDAVKAREALEAQGYRLFAKSGKTWEFKKGETPHVSAGDLYKDLPYRGVELHLEAPDAASSRLSRRESRRLRGRDVPVLCQVDILLGQAKHILKDMRGTFIRGSHLIEFHQHVLSLPKNVAVHTALEARLNRDPHESLTLGIALQLVSEVLGTHVLNVLNQSIVGNLSKEIRLWLRLYGKPSFLNVPPGTKLGLLLGEVMPRNSSISTSPLRTCSMRLPPAVIRAAPSESSATRFKRYRIQVRFIASRLRFHVVEGIRLAFERRRWKRLLGEMV